MPICLIWIWSFIRMREEDELSVLITVLWRIFGAEREEVKGEWRRLHWSSDIRILTFRRFRWVRRVAHMEGTRNARTAYEGNLKERDSLIHWRTWEFLGQGETGGGWLARTGLVADRVSLSAMLGVTSFLQGSTDGRHEAVSLGTWPAIAASSGSRPLCPFPPSPPPILPFLISVNFSFDAVQSFNLSRPSLTSNSSTFC